MSLQPLSRSAARALDDFFEGLPVGRMRQIGTPALYVERQTEALHAIAHFSETPGGLVVNTLLQLLCNGVDYYPATYQEGEGREMIYRRLLVRAGEDVIEGPDFSSYEDISLFTAAWLRSIKQQGLSPEESNMQLRLKQKQTPQTCAAFRCKSTPGGQYLGIGYLCNAHAEKAVPAQQAGTLVLVGADPVLGNDPNAKAQPLEEPADAAEHAPEPVVEQAPATAAAEPWKGELAAQQGELTEVMAMLQDFSVDTPEDVAFAEDELASTKGQWKEWEKKRTEITKPLNAGLRGINALFKPVQSALKDIETVWKKKIVAAQTAAQREQQRLLQEAQATSDPQEIQTALIAAADAPLALSGVTMRDNWKWEVTDAAQVPADYWSPCPIKIAAQVKARGGAANIAGVRVWNDPIVSSPSK